MIKKKEVVAPLDKAVKGGLKPLGWVLDKEDRLWFKKFDIGTVRLRLDVSGHPALYNLKLSTRMSVDPASNILSDLIKGYEIRFKGAGLEALFPFYDSALTHKLDINNHFDLDRVLAILSEGVLPRVDQYYATITDLQQLYTDFNRPTRKGYWSYSSTQDGFALKLLFARWYGDFDETVTEFRNRYIQWPDPYKALVEAIIKCLGSGKYDEHPLKIMSFN